MRKTNTPKRLWDDCIEYIAGTRRLSYVDSFKLQGEVPETVVTGITADISRYAEFSFYQWIWWHDTEVQFPGDKKTLGRYLGPSTDVGSMMTSKVLRVTGNTRHVSSFTALSDDELRDPDTIRRMREFDKIITRRLGPAFEAGELPEDETPEFELYADDDGKDIVDTPERDDVDEDAYDAYLKAEVLLPLRGEMKTGRVTRRKRDSDGNVIGRSHQQPILDTREYVVEFPDGTEEAYAANILAQNMIAQCDLEGNQYLLLEGIVDHKQGDDAVTRADATVMINGRAYPRKTTKGWKLCVEWRDGTTTWESLSRLKESNPVEVAEYAVANGLVDEPAFKWWVPFTLKKRDAIISAVNKRYWKRTHKFGIRLPHSVQEAIAIDKEEGNTLWQDAMQKEMNNVMVAFKILKEGESAPPGYQQIPCHMIFDVKLDNFTRKARMVAGGHKTETPATLTYASVVSRDSVRIALMMAALHDLEVKAADIQNAYLTAPCTEKIWTVCGPEFGPNEGKKAIMVRALYGLKSSGSAFRNHLADCMRHLGYTQCMADPDVWMKAMTRPDDGFKYYAYALLYVDDVLIVHHDGMAALKEIDYYFHMKESSMGDPDLYLGAKLRRFRMPNGVVSWVQSPSKYVQEAVKNVETHLRSKYDRSLIRKATSPFPRDYEPELDISEELDSEDASFYQSQIGVLRWAVELGRIDIITEVSYLASQLALPRRGHLEAVFHMFAYLKIHHNFLLALDPTYPEIDLHAFNDGTDWKGFYGDAKELIPPNIPEARGKEVVMRMFVDSDHAGDKLTRRSRTGFLIYLNMAPVLWYSKKQGTIEGAVFGAEFVAMRTSTEACRGLRYKLRMMGILVDEPVYIYGDNMSVIHNTQRPESTLKKKSNSICYHYMREAVAMGEVMTSHIRSENNPADICTKIISGGEKRNHLVSLILYNAGEDGFAFQKN